MTDSPKKLRNVHGAWGAIPIGWVRFLSRNSRLYPVIHVLSTWADDKQFVRATNKAIRDRTGMSKSTTFSALSELEACGILTQIDRNGWCINYDLIEPRQITESEISDKKVEISDGKVRNLGIPFSIQEHKEPIQEIYSIYTPSSYSPGDDSTQPPTPHSTQGRETGTNPRQAQGYDAMESLRFGQALTSEIPFREDEEEGLLGKDGEKPELNQLTPADEQVFDTVKLTGTRKDSECEEFVDVARSDGSKARPKEFMQVQNLAMHLTQHTRKHYKLYLGSGQTKAWLDLLQILGFDGVKDSIDSAMSKKNREFLEKDGRKITAFSIANYVKLFAKDTQASSVTIVEAPAKSLSPAALRFLEEQ